MSRLRGQAPQYKSIRSIPQPVETTGVAGTSKEQTTTGRWFNLRQTSSRQPKEGSNMAEHDLQSQLDELRSQLAQDTPLTDEERASLQAIAHDIEVRLSNQNAVSNDSLVDGVNLAVERFEVSHPSTAMTLRNIMQTLANMGI